MEVPQPMDEDEDSNQYPAEQSAENPCGPVPITPFWSFAENVLDCPIEIGKGKAAGSTESLSKPVCALLNAGGGIIKMKIMDFSHLTSPLKQLDGFWSTLEEKLNRMIRPSEYDDVFDRVVENDEVFLFIKAPNHLCTVDYNLFLPLDSKVLPASYQKVVNLLSARSSNIPQVPLGSLPVGLLPETFRYMQVLKFHESKQIQLKCFSSSNGILHNNNRTQLQSFKKQISAFGNGGGGMILLGVNDNGEVIGQKMAGGSEVDLEKRMDSIVKEMSRAWSFTPQRKIHWDMKLIPVINYMVPNSVVVIYIAGMRNLGGIFTSFPKSFELKSSECERKEVIDQIDFQQWKRRMLCRTQGESKGVAGVKAKFHTLSILKGPLLTVRGSVERIRKAFFAVESGCPVSPEGFERMLPERARQAIRQIQQRCSSGRNRALLVASRSWRCCLMNGSKEDGVICDLLLFSRDLGGLHLFTLCNSESEGLFLPYAQSTAKALKKALVSDGGYHEKFYISFHVVPCHAATVQVGPFSPDRRYPREYQLESSREKLNGILKSLVIVLAQVPSVLSNKQGISFLNILTVEQFQLLYQEIDRHKELWIKGAAGTGKTLVAAEFIKQLRYRDASLKKENILYICENRGIRDKMSKLVECDCFCRKSFMAQTFPEVKHVILDEVQNFRAEDGDWLEKARNLVRPHADEKEDSDLDSDSDDSVSSLDSDPESNAKLPSDPTLPNNPGSDSESDSDPDSGLDHDSLPSMASGIGSGNRTGFLWIFTDSNQVNHKFPTGIPAERSQIPCFSLTKIIRNSRSIFQYAKKFLRGDSARQIELGHDFEGEGRTFKRYSRGTEIATLKKELKSLLEEGYSEGDIAILFGKESDIPEGDLQSQLGVKQIVGADCDHYDRVVVSTFRMYSGLERPVVILCNIKASVSATYKSLVKESLYCAVTRAMMKVIVLEEEGRGNKRKHPD